MNFLVQSDKLAEEELIQISRDDLPLLLSPIHSPERPVGSNEISIPDGAVDGADSIFEDVSTEVFWNIVGIRD